MSSKEVKSIIENVSNYDDNGQLDVSIKKFNIYEERIQCPLCEHCEPILTIAHIMSRHDKTAAEAKELRDSAEKVTPFKKRGEQYNEQLREATIKR